MKKSTKVGVAAAIMMAIGIIAGFALQATHHMPGPQGTQSDPNVGSSKYLAPKKANQMPPAPNPAINPSSIQALANVNAICPWSDPAGTNPPNLQDDDKGAQTFAAMPSSPDRNTLTCAIARAKAAGYTAGDSVGCSEQTIELLDPSTNKLWEFSPFCMYVGKSGGPLCKITLVATDYAGNFLWQSEPDLSRLQDILASAIVDEDPNAYGNC